MRLLAWPELKQLECWHKMDNPLNLLTFQWISIPRNAITCFWISTTSKRKHEALLALSMPDNQIYLCQDSRAFRFLRVMFMYVKSQVGGKQARCLGQWQAARIVSHIKTHSITFLILFWFLYSYKHISLFCRVLYKKVDGTVDEEVWEKEEEDDEEVSFNFLTK